MNSENYLDHTFVVSSFDIDIWGRIRPTAILNICQDVAYLHSTSKGLGFEALLAQNMAWVLSRVKVSIERLPTWHEQIRVRTWHKGQSGLFSLRDYIFFDKDDNPLIRVTSSWLIINLATRRLGRVDKIFNQDGALTLAEHHQAAIEGEAERIAKPSAPTIVGSHRVLYSDMDINQHVNNTKYMEWACDHSEPQMQRDRQLKGFTINFNHEAKYDELITLTSTPQTQREIIIEGSTTQRDIFIVALEYASLV